MRLTAPILILLAALLTLTACGGGGSSSSAPTPPPVSPAPPPASPDFSQIINEVNRHPVANMAIVIGDGGGPLFSFEKGSFQTGDTVRMASASKLLTGLAVWTLIEDGHLQENDRAADVIAGWPADAPDVTLGQLLSFTSGFDQLPRQDTCAGQLGVSLPACVNQIVSGGSDSPPGTRFAYGPEHMQVAALMARSASGETLFTTVRRAVFDAVGATSAAGFPAFENVRYSGNARASADDYGRVLQAVLAGTLITDLDGFLHNRTAGLGTAPDSTHVREVLGWEYGFGFWLECDTIPFNDGCNSDPTISSPGLFGTVPWIDFEVGYWAIIVMEEANLTVRTTDLQQVIQPMIVSVLSD